MKYCNTVSRRNYFVLILQDAIVVILLRDEILKGGTIVILLKGASIIILFQSATSFILLQSASILITVQGASGVKLFKRKYYDAFTRFDYINTLLCYFATVFMRLVSAPVASCNYCKYIATVNLAAMVRLILYFHNIFQRAIHLANSVSFRLENVGLQTVHILCETIPVVWRSRRLLAVKFTFYFFQNGFSDSCRK